MNKKTNKLPLIAFASLPLTVGLVLAQSSTTNTASTATTAQTQPQRVQPAQPGQQNQNGQNNQMRQQSGTNYADVFLQKLAAALGISADKLKAAAINAGSATIDQGVTAGDFPNDRAAQMKADLQQNPFALGGGRGGPGGRGGHGDDHGGRMGGPRGGPAGQAVNDAVAKALGLDAQTLGQQLQSGQTIEQIAQAKGMSTATLHAAAITALKTQLTADVKAGQLTQAQADEMLQRAQDDPNFGLNPGGRGGMRGYHDHNDDTEDAQGTAAPTTDGDI